MVELIKRKFKITHHTHHTHSYAFQFIMTTLEGRHSTEIKYNLELIVEHLK